MYIKDFSGGLKDAGHAELGLKLTGSTRNVTDSYGACTRSLACPVPTTTMEMEMKVHMTHANEILRLDDVPERGSAHRNEGRRD